MKRIIFMMLLVCGMLYGAGVTGSSPGATYPRLLFLESNEITDVEKAIYDGVGNATPLSISSNGLLLNASKYIIFRDDLLKIYSSTDGQLDIDADNQLEFSSGIIDVNATGNISIETTDIINGVTVGVGSAIPISIGKAGATTTISSALSVTGTSTFTGTTILNTTNLLAKFTAGAYEIEGSNFDIDGGSIDGVAMGATTPVTAASIDNIKIDGNTISSTDTNGNINLTPNGTGSVVIAKASITGSTSFTGAVITEDLFVNGAFDCTSSDVFGVNSSQAISLNSEDEINIGTADSDTDINIGSAVSTTTFGDDVVITGKLDVAGASTFTTNIAGNITSTGTSTFSGIDVNGGSIDGTVIGGSTPAAATVSTLNTTAATTLGAELDTNGYDVILDYDGDTTISAGAVDDRIDFAPGGVDEVHIADGVVYPSVDGGSDLGKNGTNEFGSIYLKNNVDAEGDISVGDDLTVSDQAQILGLTVTGTCNIDSQLLVSTAIPCFDGEAQTLTPATGAAVVFSATTVLTKIYSDGTNAATIGDGGTQGQIKFVYVVRESTGTDVVTLSGSNVLGTSLAFDDAGSSAMLFWDDDETKWVVMSQNDCTYTP